MHNPRRTLEQRWSYHNATALCFIGIASAFDSVDRDSLWRIVAADGIPTRLSRLIKASTKMKVKVSGGDAMSLETRSPLFNNIKDWILGYALQDYPGIIRRPFRIIS